VENRVRQDHSGPQETAFFRLLAPVILRANELIVIERDELENLTAMSPGSGSEEMKTLLDLGRKYKVVGEDDELLTTEQLAELENRIDIIPPSPTLAKVFDEKSIGTLPAGPGGTINQTSDQTWSRPPTRRQDLSGRVRSPARQSIPAC